MAAAQELSSVGGETAGYHSLYNNFSYFQSLTSLALKEPQILDKVGCYKRRNKRNGREHVMEGEGLCVLSACYSSPHSV